MFLKIKKRLNIKKKSGEKLLSHLFTFHILLHISFLHFSCSEILLCGRLSAFKIRGPEGCFTNSDGSSKQ